MSCFSFGHLRARILITYDVKLTYRPNINTEPLVLITTKFCYCFLTVIGNIVYEKRCMWGTDCSNLLYFLSNRSVGFFFLFHLSLTRPTLQCLSGSVAFIKKKCICLCKNKYKIHVLFLPNKTPVLKLIRKFGCVLLRNPLKMNAEDTLTSSFKSVKYISGPYHTFKVIKYSESREYFISQI